MKHRFRQPLIGIVFDQRIDQGQRRVFRDDMALWKFSLKAPNEWR